MKKFQNYYPFLIIIGIYLIGLSSGLYIDNFPYFSIKKDASLGEIANLIFDIFVALYLNNKLSNKRSEKDILIDLAKSISAELVSLKDSVDEGGQNGRVSRRNARKIKIKIPYISKLLDDLDENITDYKSDKNINNLMIQLRKDHVTMWKWLTMKLSGNTPTISEHNFLYFEKSYFNYLSNLKKIILALNSA